MMTVPQMLEAVSVYSDFVNFNRSLPVTLGRMPEREPVISRPLPVIGNQQLATPRVVAEPRNVTVEVFKALADPVRLELLALIAAGGPICVCHLHDRVAYSQSRVSKHLGTLRKAGLVTTRREGTWVYYSLSQDALEIGREFLDQLERSTKTPHAADYCPPT